MAAAATQALVAAVKAQSQALAGGAPGVGDSWQASDWRQAFDGLFLSVDPAAGAGHQDDMLFFVRPQQAASDEQEQIFVRRWTRELPREIVADWRESVYLNLIVHTRFTLTVAICSYAALKDRSRPGPRTFVKVVKPVYAAPSVARVDLKTSKAAATQISWPDVYFAVYDYVDAFDATIISDPDHCLVVELRAWGGLAIADGGRDAAACGELGEGAPQVSLFSGLVGNDAMQAAFKKVSAGGAALRFGGASRAERVVMAGPGGRGRVEVAVSEPQQQLGAEGGDDAAGRPGGRAGAAVVGAARAVAKGLMRGGEPLALQCCVMSVCLPWDTLARDVLFKSPSTTGS